MAGQATLGSRVPPSVVLGIAAVRTATSQHSMIDLRAPDGTCVAPGALASRVSLAQVEPEVLDGQSYVNDQPIARCAASEWWTGPRLEVAEGWSCVTTSR